MSDSPLKVLLARSDGLVFADYLLGEGIYVIGSGAGAQLKVDTAAELHARLEVSEAGFFIEDTSGSGGGTFLDGAAVRLQITSDRFLARPQLTICRAFTSFRNG